MAARPPEPAANADWEREHAPHPSAPYFYAVAALFVAWVGFLAAMAIYRWYVTLQ